MTDEAAAQATTVDTAIDTTAAPEPTALRQAAVDTPAQAATATPVDKIPEKFRTVRDDGTVDLEASAAKMAESYSYLEKKLGSGEAPPKSPDEYAPVFSEGTPIAYDDIKEDPVLQEFMQGAHQVGLTNAQVSYVLDQYMKVLPQDIAAHSELDSAETINQLRETTWKTDVELKAGLADAFRAVNMVAGDDADYLMDRYGNDPAFIRFVAKFGEGLREDSPPQAMQMVSPEEFTESSMAIAQQLMDMPMNDPRRPALLKKQEEMYRKQYGETPAHGLG